MADVDLGKLQILVDELNKKSKTFADATKTILDQAKTLDSSARDLTANTNSWAGKGSKAFLDTWNHYHRETLRSALALESTSKALSKLAQKLKESAQNLIELQNQAVMMGLVTTGLVIADVAQGGLDPFTDTATVVSVGDEATLQSQIEAEQNAIVEIDTQISAELDEITNQIENSTQLEGLTTDESSELNHLESEFLQEEIQDSDRTKFYSWSGSQAEGESTYENPLNTDDFSSEENMPLGIKNDIGKSWLKQAQDLKGQNLQGQEIEVEVKWDYETQTQLDKDGKMLGGKILGTTDVEFVNGQPRVVIALSPDATNADMYEEYLHAQNIIAEGGRMPLGDEAVWKEEIRAETQVLQDATNLDMTSSEFNGVAKVRQSYINKLKGLYEDQNWPWPPDGLDIQDPLKPPNLR